MINLLRYLAIGNHIMVCITQYFHCTDLTVHNYAHSKIWSESTNQRTNYVSVGNGKIRRHFGIFSETML